MTQLQEAIRDKITTYSDACGRCTDIMKDCDICGVIWMLEDLNELQKLADDPDAVRPTAHIMRGTVPDTHDDAFCSNCRSYLGVPGVDYEDYDSVLNHRYKYCPYCGARMVNEDELQNEGRESPRFQPWDDRPTIMVFFVFANIIVM